MRSASNRFLPVLTNGNRWLWLGALLLLAAGCRTTVEMVEMGDLRPSGLNPEEAAALVNRESPILERVSGEGRLLISQPGGSDRISVSFQADGDRALYSFRNRIGVDGGRLLVDEDSIRVWDKLEDVVRIVSRENPDLTPLGALATLSLPDLFQFRVHPNQIDQVLEDDTHLNIQLSSGARLIVEKSSGAVLELHRTREREALYDRAIFELHREQGAFRLPGRITIFGRDGETRLTLLLRETTPNPEATPLTLDLPADIRTERL